MIYGYARISRKEQNIERQVRNILQYNSAARITQEAYTGTKLEGRAGLEKMLKLVQPGDTIIFDSVSRMSRNADEGVQLYKDLFVRGVELVFLKERHIDTATYKQAISSGVPMTGTDVDVLLKAVNKYLMILAEKQIVLAFEQAQKEVDDLHERTREGIETARQNGKQIGQQEGRKLNVKKAAVAKEIICKHSKDFHGTLTDAECITLAGISRNSFYKYKRELKEEMPL